jgi:hypothetical protein
VLKAIDVTPAKGEKGLTCKDLNAQNNWCCPKSFKYKVSSTSVSLMALQCADESNPISSLDVWNKCKTGGQNLGAIRN